MLRRHILILAGALMMAPAARPATAETVDAILDSLQFGAFRFFWEEANPANGLIRDRSTPGSVCSIASTGTVTSKWRFTNCRGQSGQRTVTCASHT